MWTLLLTLASAADLAPRADVESLSGLPAPTAWEASDGSLGTPEGRDLAEAVDGGRLWLGVLGDSGHETAWLTRLDARGAPVWSRRYDAAVALSPWQVVGAVDGGAWVIGATPDARGDDVAVLRVDATGEPVSLRRLGADVGGKEQIRHAVRTADGGLLLTGDLTRGDDVRGLVIRLDAAGEVLWSTILDADARARDGLSAGLEVDGGVVVVGRSKGEGAYPSEAGWVARLDGSGAVVRSELVVDLADDVRLSDVAVGADGLVLAGASAGSKPLVVWLDGDDVGGAALETSRVARWAWRATGPGCCGRPAARGGRRSARARSARRPRCTAGRVGGGRSGSRRRAWARTARWCWRRPASRRRWARTRSS
jgi:hypothetical protein